MTDVLSFEETSRFLDTPKGKLHYHVAGDGPPLLLLLHGSGPGVSGWANFRGNLPVLAREYTTYVLDFPGFGKSYSPDANPLAVGPAGVLDFLDGMGLGPLPIIGNSMGGNVAARIAAEYPERVSRLLCIGGVGLSLLSPSPPEGIKLPTRPRRPTSRSSTTVGTRSPRSTRVLPDGCRRARKPARCGSRWQPGRLEATRRQPDRRNRMSRLPERRLRRWEHHPCRA